MEQALNIFTNGIIGVFAGMAVLYVMMKLISAFASDKPGEKKEDEA